MSTPSWIAVGIVVLALVLLVLLVGSVRARLGRLRPAVATARQTLGQARSTQARVERLRGGLVDLQSALAARSKASQGDRG